MNDNSLDTPTIGQPKRPTLIVPFLGASTASEETPGLCQPLYRGDSGLSQQTDCRRRSQVCEIRDEIEKGRGLFGDPRIKGGSWIWCRIHWGTILITIIFLQLSSIPDLQPIKSQTSDSIINNPEKTSTESDQIKQDITEPPAVNSQVGEKPEIETIKEEDTEKVVVAAGIKASEDYRYKKYFKMIHYGAHPQAVKNKVASEGLDPSILE